MKTEKRSKRLYMMVMGGFLMVMVWSASETLAAEIRYPNKPIQVVICYPPGATDVAMRPVVEKLQEYFGQPIVFIYKPGGAGAIGASFVAKAKPDGYTFIGTSHQPIVINPLTKEGLDYTLDDFVPTCRIVRVPYFLCVSRDSPWKSLKDLVEDAKKKPGKISYAAAAFLSTQFFMAYRFIRSAGIELTNVPVLGDVPGVTSVLGGHIDFTVVSATPAVPHIMSGALRPLAVFTRERLKGFADVPTIYESGYPVGFYYSWYGFLAPKGTPEEIVKTFCKAAEKVVKDHKDSLEEQLEKLSLMLEFRNNEEYAKEIKRDNEVIKEIVKEFKEAKKL